MKKLISLMDNINKNMYYLLIAAGAYLVYLSIDILRNMANTEGSKVPLYIASVLFAACGAGIAVLSVYALVDGHYSEKNPPRESEDTAEDEQPSEVDGPDEQA